MELHNLKEDCCPICGCSTVIAESVDIEISPRGPQKVYKHTNGAMWEHKTFLCGFGYDFIPNFMHSEPSAINKCSNDPEIIARAQKKKADIAAILAFMEASDISKGVREELTSRLNCL